MPTFRETILKAGALNEPDQPRAYEELCDLLANAIDSTLRGLGTEAGLRSALQEGRLMHGLVRKGAREYLDG